MTALLLSRDRVEATLIGRWDFPPSLTSPSRAWPDPDEPKQNSLMGVASDSGAGARLVKTFSYEGPYGISFQMGVPGLMCVNLGVLDAKRVEIAWSQPLTR